MSQPSTPVLKPSDPPVGGLVEQFAEIKRCLDANMITQEEAGIMRMRIITGGTNCETKVGSTEPETLTKYFKDAELRSHQPWRRDMEKFETLSLDWAQMSIDDKRDVFLNKAKTNLLTPCETMLSVYLLYGNETDLDFLRSLLVCSSGSLRLLMHNLYVAKNREPSFLNSYGERIVDLSVPLFPAAREFSAINTMVLEESVQGGGPGRKIFKEGEEGDPLGGGPIHFFLQTNEEGNHYVDMTNVDAAVGALQREIASIKAQGNRTKAPWWKNKKQYNNNQHYQHNYASYHQPAPPYHNQQHSNQQNGNQPNNSYQARGNPSGAGEAPVSAPATVTKKN